MNLMTSPTSPTHETPPHIIRPITYTVRLALGLLALIACLLLLGVAGVKGMSSLDPELEG
jgi:hypothetical protein